VIRHSPVPVLAIHPKNTYKPYEKVLLSVDVFEDKSLIVIQKALEFLKPWAGVRVILSVINTPYVFYDTPTIQKFVERLRGEVSYDLWELKVYNDISVEEGVRQVSAVSLWEYYGECGAAPFLSAVSYSVGGLRGGKEGPKKSLKSQGVLFPSRCAFCSSSYHFETEAFLYQLHAKSF
jgi:hypothetical protein